MRCNNLHIVPLVSMLHEQLLSIDLNVVVFSFKPKIQIYVVQAFMALFYNERCY